MVSIFVIILGILIVFGGIVMLSTSKEKISLKKKSENETEEDQYIENPNK